MARELGADERLVCIGQTALRGPDGAPLPSVPLYIIVDKKSVDEETGVSAGEDRLFSDIGGVIAREFNKYIDGLAEIEARRRRERK